MSLENKVLVDKNYLTGLGDIAFGGKDRELKSLDEIMNNLKVSNKGLVDDIELYNSLRPEQWGAPLPSAKEWLLKHTEDQPDIKFCMFSYYQPGDQPGITTSGVNVYFSAVVDIKRWSLVDTNGMIPEDFDPDTTEPTHTEHYNAGGYTVYWGDCIVQIISTNTMPINGTTTSSSSMYNFGQEVDICNTTRSTVSLNRFTFGRTMFLNIESLDNTRVSPDMAPYACDMSSAMWAPFLVSIKHCNLRFTGTTAFANCCNNLVNTGIDPLYCFSGSFYIIDSNNNNGVMKQYRARFVWNSTVEPISHTNSRLNACVSETGFVFNAMSPTVSYVYIGNKQINAGSYALDPIATSWSGEFETIMNTTSSTYCIRLTCVSESILKFIDKLICSDFWKNGTHTSKVIKIENCYNVDIISKSELLNKWTGMGYSISITTP